jgi:hypothetical protein
MKSFLYSLLLVGTLASCSKNDDPAVAPAPNLLLGHWKSGTLRHLEYDGYNRQTEDETTQVTSQLDVTATTLTLTTIQPDGKTSTEVDKYVRDGETITVTPTSGNSGGKTISIRGLTTTSFLFEFNSPHTDGKGYYVESTPFHR